MQLKPIRPKRIADQVFEQIRELIYKGEFKPGQQILPERELAMSLPEPGQIMILPGG